MVSALYGSYGLAGRVSAVYVVAQAVCSPQLARLVDRHGQARVMRPAVAIAAVGLRRRSSSPRRRRRRGLAVRRRGHHRRGRSGRSARWSGPAGPACSAPTRTGCTPPTRWSRRSTSSCSSSDRCSRPCSRPASPRPPGWSCPLVAMLVGGYWFLVAAGTEPPPAPVGCPRPRGSVLRRPGMVVLAIVFVAMGAIFGATDVSTVAFAEESGSKGVGRRHPRDVRARLADLRAAVRHARSGSGRCTCGSPSGWSLLAVGVCFFFLVQSLVALAAVMFVTGFAIAPTLINGNGLVQQLVPRARLTEGLTWVGTSLGVGVSIGSSIAGARIDAARLARRVPRGRGRRRVRRRRDAGRAADPARRRRRARARLGGAGSPSSTGGAAVAACEIAESVDPSRSVGTLDA